MTISQYSADRKLTISVCPENRYKYRSTLGYSFGARVNLYSIFCGESSRDEIISDMKESTQSTSPNALHIPILMEKIA